MHICPLGGSNTQKHFPLAVQQSTNHSLNLNASLKLTVESHVFGKGLWQDDVVSLFNEVPHSPGITINVPTCKALVGHVEERQQVSLLHKSDHNNKVKSSRL